MITLLAVAWFVYKIGGVITALWLCVALIDALRIGIAAPGDLPLMIILIIVGAIAWPWVLPELVRG